MIDTLYARAHITNSNKKVLNVPIDTDIIGNDTILAPMQVLVVINTAPNNLLLINMR